MDGDVSALADAAAHWFAVYAKENDVAYALTHGGQEESITTSSPAVLTGQNIDGTVLWRAVPTENGYYFYHEDLEEGTDVLHYLNVDANGSFVTLTYPETVWSQVGSKLQYQSANGTGYLAYSNGVLFTTSDYASAAQVYYAAADEIFPEQDSYGMVFPAMMASANDAPAHSKDLIDNGDGTYTIALNVTGAASSSSTTTVSKSNIVLALDISSSMNTNYTTYNGTRMTRLNAMKHVLTDNNGIIDQLLAKNTAQYPDIVEIAIATFGREGGIAQTATYNKTTLKNTINGLGYTSGTNWEEGLEQAKALADTFKSSQPDEDVYVIFMTDGQPTTWHNQYRVSTVNTAWNNAAPDARAIGLAGYHFYGLFTWGSGNNSHYLSSLVNYAYTGTGDYNTALPAAYQEFFTDATDTEALIDALVAIVDQITTSVGYTNVEMEDGITTMTASSVSSSVDGTVSGIKYYRSGGSYSTTANNGLGEEWADAPAATFTNGVVDWNLDDIVLEDGVTYTIAFVVWPSQAASDLVADLNNGKKNYADLTDAEKSQVIVSGGVYSLKTNTDFPKVTYSTVTTTTQGGETTTVVSDPVTVNITNPDPVGLAESISTLQKKWNVDLQKDRFVSYLYYTYDSADHSNGDPKEVSLTFTVNMDGEAYKTVTLGWDEETQDYVWYDTPESVSYNGKTYNIGTIWAADFALSNGNMLTKDRVEDLGLDTTKYSTVTYSGTTYYILEVGHDYDVVEPALNSYNFDYVPKTYHPMLINGELKNVTFTYGADGKTITGIDSVEDMSNGVRVNNYLRGGINLNKIVLDPQGNEYAADQKFSFTISLVNESEVFEGDNIPWYSVNGNYYHDDDGNYISEDEAKEKYGDSYSGHGNILTAANAKHASTTVAITCEDTVRIANVPFATTYTVTETPVNGYDLTKIERVVNPADASEDTTTDTSITAVIVANAENNISFTNQMTEYPSFYVYHSGDNTIEKIFVDDSRVDATIDETTGLYTYTFNIANETKTGYLYGGYYKSYKGQKLTDAQIVAGTYTSGDSGSYTYYTGHPTTGNWLTDTGATAYTYAYVKDGNRNVWGSDYYTADGRTMNPASNTVYYLKEVPNYYLLPYAQYTYGTGDKVIHNMWFISALDDLNYESGKVGFVVIQENKFSTIVDTLTVKTSTGNASVTLSPKSLFGNKGGAGNGVQAGYLGYWDASGMIKANESVTLIPFWTTMDGVKVSSTTSRTINFNNGKVGTGGMRLADTVLGSTLADRP